MLHNRENNDESRKGQSLVEYAMILVLVAVLCLAGLTAIGGETDRLIPQLSEAIAGESSENPDNTTEENLR